MLKEILFEGNLAESTGSSSGDVIGAGASIRVRGKSHVSIEKCQFIDNQATSAVNVRAAALDIDTGSSATGDISDCIVQENHAGGSNAPSSVVRL